MAVALTEILREQTDDIEIAGMALAVALARFIGSLNCSRKQLETGISLSNEFVKEMAVGTFERLHQQH